VGNAMNWRFFTSTLRFRLVFASVVVEVILLGLLVFNSHRLIERNLIEQTQIRIAELQPLLNAALAGPLAARDYATLADILDASRRKEGLDYLVLLDHRGKVVAAAGWDMQLPLPMLDRDVGDRDADGSNRYDTQMPITLAGQQYGILRYGLSTALLILAKQTLLQQSLLIAAVEVSLSVLLLALIGAWLTRNLEQLAVASRQVAAGDFHVNLPVRSRDEVGALTEAFNTMSGAIRQKLTELQAGNARLHAIADYTYGWENWFAPEGKLLWVNPSVERLTGYTQAECQAMAGFPFSVMAKEDVERARVEFQQAARGGTGSNFEFRVRRKDGSEFWAAASWQPIYGVRGEFLGHRSSIWDISERKHFELALQEKVTALEQSEEKQKLLVRTTREEQARLNHLLSAMNIGILFEDGQHRVVYSNPAFRRVWLIPESIDLLGRTTKEVMQHSANILSRPDNFSKHILDVLGTHEVSENFEIVLSDGRVLTQLSYPVHDAEERFIGRLWIYEDVTRERQTAEQLIYLAERDSLTGLYNRHRFQMELGRKLAETERRRSQGALLFFDLDEFKYINDTFGHRAGDAMLIRVAGEVGALVRRNEVIARLGGDEFAVLMPDAEEAQAVQLAERIIRAVSQIPFRFEQQNLRLTTSLGIALYPQHGSDTEELVARADAAMYQAKDAGKNAWRIYRPESDASREMLDRLSWQERIRHALENNLLRLHYQGVYRAADGTLSHLEVLVRMLDETDPERIIMPGHFIGYAEKSDKIRDIDRWVIAESVKMLARSPDMPSLAVNISGRSFDDPTLPQYIAEQLSQRRVAPARLLVELTETSAVSDLHDAQRFIEALRQTGCLVCLDDFGTGFSSFAYLKHLRADVLKIDGLFIRDLPNDRDNQVFVKAIVDVARGMRKATIAEFVEDAETLEMLRHFGVDMAQGYHLDMPRGNHPAVIAHLV
jgi:diguanylate cyclase (GGDEF)-like protein/PAS domain S-box-containing protein